MIKILAQPKRGWPDDLDEIRREARGGMTLAAWILAAGLVMLFVPSIVAMLTHDPRWISIPFALLSLSSYWQAFRHETFEDIALGLVCGSLLAFLALGVGGLL